MDTNTDRRIVHTKLVIREALIALIEEKGFDFLTVKDITTRANINRGTFYLHYHDKLDLLEQIEAEILQDILDIILQADASDVVALASNDQPMPIAIKIFEYLNANASLINSLIGIKGDFSFQTHLKKVMWSNLFADKFATFIKKEQLLIPSDYLIAYVASANLGVIQQWLKEGRHESPQEMALILAKLTIKGPLFAAGITSPGK